MRPMTKEFYGLTQKLMQKKTAFISIKYHKFDHGCSGLYSLHVSSWEYNWIFNQSTQQIHNKRKYDILR